jgi:hypothetical protein
MALTCACDGAPLAEEPIRQKIEHAETHCVSFELFLVASSACDSCHLPHVGDHTHFTLKIYKQENHGRDWFRSNSALFPSYDDPIFDKLNDACCAECYARDHSLYFTYCEDCARYTFSGPAVGASPAFHVEEYEQKHIKYMEALLGNRFAPPHVYDIAVHAAEFWRRRKVKFRDAVYGSALSDLADVIAQYL